MVFDGLPAELRRSGRGVGVGEPVEAEPAEVPPRAPLERQGVGGGGGRDGCVKRGVEAADLWDAGQEPADQLERVKRGGLMERREVDQRVELPEHRRVDHDRIDQLAATVDDAVADGIDAGRPARAPRGAPPRPRAPAGAERRPHGAGGRARRAATA